jgi:hypothetical protein
MQLTVVGEWRPSQGLGDSPGRELIGCTDLSRAIAGLVRRRWLSILPKSLEPVGRHFRVAHRVRDVLVSQVMLQRAGVVASLASL